MLGLWLMQSSGDIFKEVPLPCGLGHPRIASNLHPWAGNYRAVAVSPGADSPEPTEDRNFCFKIGATSGGGGGSKIEKPLAGNWPLHIGWHRPVTEPSWPLFSLTDWGWWALPQMDKEAELNKGRFLLFFSGVECVLPHLLSQCGSFTVCCP